MKDTEAENLRQAFKLCGINIDLKTCAIIWRVAYVVKFKGNKFSVKDAAEIEAEVNKHSI